MVFWAAALWFQFEKENLPENSIYYVNQGYQSVKDNKKIYYADIFLIGQVNECLNPPENVDSYEYGEREVVIYRPKYDKVTGASRGLYETLGYIMVRGDPQEHFFGLWLQQRKFEDTSFLLQETFAK